MRAFDLATRMPWAITEEGLRLVLQIAERSLADVDLAAAIRAERETRPSALAAQAGRPLDNTRAVTVRDGVAILQVEGPLVRRADLFSEMSGASSVGTLAQDFAQAISAPNVGAVLLVIDSPGGEVTGIHEFAQQIAAARAGDTPVWAYVEGLGASAAYWLASAADRIVVDATAGLGSIGVVMAVPDPEKRTAKTIEIVSSQSPKKRPNVATESGRQQLQTVVDDTAAVFVADVAANRGISEDQVLADFGQGDIFIGQRAVDQGLADALGSFEGTLAELAQIARRAPHQRRMTAEQESTLMADEQKGGFWAWITGTPQTASAPTVTTGDAVSVSVSAAAPAPQSTQTPVQAADDTSARLTALEAQLAEERKLREQAQSEAQVAQAAVVKAAGEARAQRIAALAGEFHGETAAHVTVLTALADAGGEDGAAFTAYVTTQRAAAEAIASGALFKELGNDKPGASGDATAQFMAAVAAKRQADAKLSLADAMSAVAQEQPALYEAHAAASSIKVG